MIPFNFSFIFSSIKLVIIYCQWQTCYSWRLLWVWAFHTQTNQKIYTSLVMKSQPQILMLSWSDGSKSFQNSNPMISTLLERAMLVHIKLMPCISISLYLFILFLLESFSITLCTSRSLCSSACQPHLQEKPRRKQRFVYKSKGYHGNESDYGQH